MSFRNTYTNQFKPHHSHSKPTLADDDNRLENLFLTSQSQFLTLWQFEPPQPIPSGDIPKNDKIQCLPIITLDAGFEILNAEFSPDNSLVVVSGVSHLVLTWELSSELFKVVPLRFSSEREKLNQAFLRFYQNYHPHTFISTSQLRNYPQFFKLWDLKELIQNHYGQPLLPAKPSINFTRLIRKGRGYLLLLGGSELKGIYQIDMLANKLLETIKPGENRDIIGVSINCDLSLIGIISQKNTIVITYRELGTRHVIPITINKQMNQNDIPVSISFSVFEKHQFMIGYRSGAVAVFDCFHFLKGSSSSNGNTLTPLHFFTSTSTWSNSSSTIKPVFTQFNRFLIAKASIDGKIMVSDISKMKLSKQLIIDCAPSSIRFGVTGAHIMIGTEKGGLDLYDVRSTGKPVWQLRPPTNLIIGPIKVIEFQNHTVKKESKSISNWGDSDKIKIPSTTLENFRSNSLAGKRLSSHIIETKSKSMKYTDIQPDEDKLNIDLPPPSILTEPSFIDVFSPIKKKQPDPNRNFNNDKPMYNSPVFSKKTDNAPPSEKPLLSSGFKSNNIALHKTNFSLKPPIKNLNATKEIEIIDLDEVPANNSTGIQPKSSSQMPPPKPASPEKLTKAELNSYIKDVPAAEIPESLDSKNNIFVNLVREVVQDTNRSLRVDIKHDIDSVHLELLSQIHDLKKEMKELLRNSSQVPELQHRIKALEEENRRLRLDY